jgi:hypothetical protein
MPPHWDTAEDTAFSCVLLRILRFSDFQHIFRTIDLGPGLLCTFEVHTDFLDEQTLNYLDQPYGYFSGHRRAVYLQRGAITGISASELVAGETVCACVRRLP